MTQRPSDPTLLNLATSLAHHVVPYLRIAADGEFSPTPPPPEVLISQLARHPEPRVREALIPLFLRHPEYHQFVPELALRLDPEAALTLRHFYTAAVYLQHLWRGTLSLYLGSITRLPNYFGETEFELPAPNVHWGEAGLRLLAARFHRETGYNWLAMYESALSRFLAIQQLRSISEPDARHHESRTD